MSPGRGRHRHHEVQAIVVTRTKGRHSARSRCDPGHPQVRHRGLRRSIADVRHLDRRSRLRALVVTDDRHAEVGLRHAGRRRWRRLDRRGRRCRSRLAGHGERRRRRLHVGVDAVQFLVDGGVLGDHRERVRPGRHRVRHHPFCGLGAAWLGAPLTELAREVGRLVGRIDDRGRVRVGEARLDADGEIGRSECETRCEHQQSSGCGENVPDQLLRLPAGRPLDFCLRSSYAAACCADRVSRLPAFVKAARPRGDRQVARFTCTSPGRRSTTKRRRWSGGCSAIMVYQTMYPPKGTSQNLGRPKACEQAPRGARGPVL